MSLLQVIRKPKHFTPNYILEAGGPRQIVPPGTGWRLLFPIETGSHIWIYFCPTCTHICRGRRSSALFTSWNRYGAIMLMSTPPPPIYLHHTHIFINEVKLLHFFGFFLFVSSRWVLLFCVCPVRCGMRSRMIDTHLSHWDRDKMTVNFMTNENI